VKHGLVPLESCDRIPRRTSSSYLPEGVLVANCPANDAPQVGIGVAPEITQKSCVMGELQKFALNYIVRAEIPSCHNGRP
jgi:hypothetical protein